MCVHQHTQTLADRITSPLQQRHQSLSTLFITMTQLHVATTQNRFLMEVDMERELNALRPLTTSNLQQLFIRSTEIHEEILDQVFATTCVRITSGYTWKRKVLSETNCINFKVAMRRYPAFLALPARTRSLIFREIKYVTKIVERWNDIVHNCTLPHMVNLDVRPYALWRLSKCTDLKFVEQENQRGEPTPNVPVGRTYPIDMVRDILDNRDGATDAILLLVGEDQHQLTMIANDFKSLLLRRANGAA